MVLGVDIGGTKIATGLVNERAEVSRSRSVPTLANQGYDASIGQVWAAIGESLTGDVEAIGICARWVRLESSHDTGPWFRWASVGVDAAAALAAQVGLTLTSVEMIGGRVIASLAFL